MSKIVSQPSEHLPVYLTAARVEKLLDVGPSFLSQLVASGQLRAYRLGSRSLRFELADVLDALKPVSGRGRQ